MSRLLEKHSSFLKTLASVDTRIAENILEDADEGEIKCISEIAYNILYGSVPLTFKEKRILKEYKICIKQFAKKKVSKNLLKTNVACVQYLIKVVSKIL